MKPTLPIILALMLLSLIAYTQEENGTIPSTHSNIKVDTANNYYIQIGKTIYPEIIKKPSYTLQQMIGNPTGTEKGILFDFQDSTMKGILYFGLIPYGDSKHPMPVYRTGTPIKRGKALVDFDKFRGTYDMIGWEKEEKGTLGYRVRTVTGRILYDGIVSFAGKGPFTIDHTIWEGPLVNMLTAEGATISFKTNHAINCKVLVGNKTFESPKGTEHEVLLSGLKPDTEYTYTVIYGDNEQSYAFRTAPRKGSRNAFTFSYASDSRTGTGGGERSFFGVNAYIMKKIMALNMQQKTRFMQFSGDLISGYRLHEEEARLEYVNWKHAIQPFAHYMPVVATMGNHEALVRAFQQPADSVNQKKFYLDKFPYATSSAEAIFGQEFVNPSNGPKSEDGSSYDPDLTKIDFPSYKENVFYYTYDNVAMVVLNSNYWFAPRGSEAVGGNTHAYIMDNQLLWLKSVLKKLESDKRIDHIFITLHTPFFPNGGHVGDDMWYNGNNQIRPTVAGQKVKKGILQRRDDLLDLLVNKTKKVCAILTGDEHNYCRTKVGPETTIYPADYKENKIKLSRTIWQINNGAAGAPYYGQQQTPWSNQVAGFTTQNALVLFNVKGKVINVQVLNPDTLEEVDSFKLVKE
ncbi:MAG: metallophosphoesterase family protein [Saprospiraceae bacterium]|nr:metallophosphoesterase family protein [Saprospiraceae bacterium]